MGTDKIIEVIKEKMAHVLNDIVDERERQEALRLAGRFDHTCASTDAVAMPNAKKLAVLMEEVGEAARALLELEGGAHDKHGVELRTELIQIAACCVAWCEALDAAGKQ